MWLSTKALSSVLGTLPPKLGYWHYYITIIKSIDAIQVSPISSKQVFKARSSSPESHNACCSHSSSQWRVVPSYFFDFHDLGSFEDCRIVFIKCASPYHYLVFTVIKVSFLHF